MGHASVYPNALRYLEPGCSVNQRNGCQDFLSPQRGHAGACPTKAPFATGHWARIPQACRSWNAKRSESQHPNPHRPLDLYVWQYVRRNNTNFSRLPSKTPLHFKSAVSMFLQRLPNVGKSRRLAVCSGKVAVWWGKVAVPKP